MKSKFLTLLVVLFISKFAFAGNFKVGSPILSGSGCPSGSTGVAVAPDSSSISLLFDNFSVSAPKGSVSGASASCTFSIPVLQLPPKTTLRALWIDYRGFVNLPKGASGKIQTTNRISVPDSEAFPPMSEEWFLANGSALVQDFLKRVKTNQGFPKFCSSNTKIEVKTSIEINPASVKQGRRFRAIPYESDASLVIDTADISGRNGPIQIGIDFEPCSNDRNTGGCLPDGALLEGESEDQGDGYREFEDDRCCSGVAYVGSAPRYPRCGRQRRD